MINSKENITTIVLHIEQAVGIHVRNLFASIEQVGGKCIFSQSPQSISQSKGYDDLRNETTSTTKLIDDTMKW